MPPKKKAGDDESRIVLGRPGNNLKMGIVGLPNVGKSTLFTAMTEGTAEAANYPFCTIDPNVSRCAVPDERFDWLCEHWQPASRVPAFLHVTDIAGLVKGASEGAGLGNAFLSHISAVDGIFHVCRAFEDPDVSHVEDSVDPVRDLDIIHGELIAKDRDHVAKHLDARRKVLERSKEKAAKDELAALEKLSHLLEEGKDARYGEWTATEAEIVNAVYCLTAKPVVYLVNVSKKDYLRRKNKWLPKIKEWVDANGGGPIIPFSGLVETELANLPDEAAHAAYKEECGGVSILTKMVTAGYHHLNLVHFFTCGKDEVRCWTIQRGSKAPQAAGTIHTDFEKGFIMAEVMKYADYRELESEAAVKAAGKYRQQGKGYVVEDGDIIFFKFNAGAGLKSGKK